MLRATSTPGWGAPRRGFTLLEVLLASAIGVLLIIALYAAISTQVQQAQSGREVIEEAMLARAVLTRLSNDIQATANLCDGARYRLQQGGSNSAPSSSMDSSSSSSDSSGMMSMDTDPMVSTTGPVVLTLGVRGDSETLTLFVSKYPGEVYPNRSGDPGELASDLRRISYWIATGDVGGLARQEIKVITAEDVIQDISPIGSEIEPNGGGTGVIAPEVRTIQFEYFDGTTWQASWDSSAPGTDGMTPQGAPRAIAITLGLLRSGKVANATEELKMIRHVVAIPTANGTTSVMDDSPLGGTTP